MPESDLFTEEERDRRRSPTRSSLRTVSHLPSLMIIAARQLGESKKDGRHRDQEHGVDGEHHAKRGVAGYPAEDSIISLLDKVPIATIAYYNTPVSKSPIR